MGDNDGSGEGPPSSVGIERTPLSVGLAVAALLLILPGIRLMLLRFAWTRGLSTEPSARRRYGHLRRSLRLGRADVPESATPFERANWVGAHLPDVAAPVELLVRRHVEATYGGFSSPDSAADSEAAWRLISRPLLLAMVRRRLGRVDPDAAWQAPRRPRWAELLRRRRSRRGPEVPGSPS